MLPEKKNNEHANHDWQIVGQDAGCQPAGVTNKAVYMPL
jgi:hypothetical protein